MKLSSVFAKTLHDQRRSFIGWAIGLGVLVVLMSLMWPSVRDIPGLEKFMKQYPAALRKVFNVETMDTGAGYLNTELFTLMLPALFLVFAIGRGARLIAGEEEDHTLDVLVCSARSRRRILIEKAAALAVTVLALGGVLFVVTVAMSAVVDLGIGFGDLGRGELAMTALGLEFGLLALAVGAMTGRRGIAIAVPTIVAVAGYVLYVLGQIIHAVEPWRGLSPFAQALSHGPIGSSWSPGLAVMVGVGLAFVAIGLPIFDRRDLSA